MSTPARITEPPGTAPGASALNEFISISNSLVVMLTVLAEDIRTTEPGTAEVITTYTEAIAGQAIDLIAGLPA